MWMVARYIGHCVKSTGFPIFSYLPPFNALTFFTGSCEFNLFTHRLESAYHCHRMFPFSQHNGDRKNKIMLNSHD